MLKNLPPFYPWAIDRQTIFEISVDHIDTRFLSEDFKRFVELVNWNGPWPASTYPLKNMLEFIPIGEFWIGLHGNSMQKQAIPTNAGIFVGFRRKYRPQNNPWWLEVVYTKQDVNGHLVLQAYSYNFLGMPLTPISRNHGWFWRVKYCEVIWLGPFENLTKEGREGYVEHQQRIWGPGGGSRLSSWIPKKWAETKFDLPPYQF